MSHLDLFLKNTKEMTEAIRRCLDLRQHIPALTLMYALIDSLAWSTSIKSSRNVRERFEGWAEKWLLPHLRLKAPEVNATDLYGARCAVLHTLTSDSELSNIGKARRIAYAWGGGKTVILREMLDKKGFTNILALHFEDLFNAVSEAIASCVKAAEGDPLLASRLEEAASKHYTSVSSES